MTDDLRTSFLTFYIRSLGERTREESSGTKFGFDWIIYNLQLSAGWFPHRLPFLRTGSDETSKSKTEAEFGIDLAFLSPDRKILRIFVLKDEVLNNKNWTGHDFDTDIRNACAPDLTKSELREVETVEVILAYNKDEDRTGLELYERRIAALGTKVGDAVALKFDRWNLSTIVEKVRDTLLSPALLPQKFFSQFTYICSQFRDFTHGSDEWTHQLIPNWQNFLQSLFANDADIRCVHLLPVVLIILRERMDKESAKETGWIDLAEWGMLASWNVFQSTKKEAVKDAIVGIWYSVYLTELQRYYRSHANELSVRYALEKMVSGSYVDAIASAVVSQWHVARIGILGMGVGEWLEYNDDLDEAGKVEVLNQIAEIQMSLLMANPSSLRPLLDIHHIQAFLTWFVLCQIGRHQDIRLWLQTLLNRLFMRRSGQSQIPFIESQNQLELVFESVATGKKPPEFCDASSVYLLCLLELTCSLPGKFGDSFLEKIYRRLVLGRADCGKQMDGCVPIDLMMWLPAEDWQEHIFTRRIHLDGECVNVVLGSMGETEPANGATIRKWIEEFVAVTRRERPFSFPDEIFPSVIALACIKHGTPLPPEMWRHHVFKTAGTEEEPAADETIDPPPI